MGKMASNFTEKFKLVERIKTWQGNIYTVTFLKKNRRTFGTQISYK
jgi:hypothetical protein